MEPKFKIGDRVITCTDSTKLRTEWQNLTGTITAVRATHCWILLDKLPQSYYDTNPVMFDLDQFSLIEHKPMLFPSIPNLFWNF